MSPLAAGRLLLPLLLALLLALLPLSDRAAAASPASSSTDSELLLAFKASFLNGDDVLESWTADEGGPCNGWVGITCNNDSQVIGIEIGPKPPFTTSPLQGTIPAAGWTLPATLQRLDLARNLLVGSLPADLGLLGCPSLEFFSLAWNSLKDVLPSLALPPSLQTLSLSGNRFRGPVPANWTLPPALQRLELSYNSIGGSIAEAWLQGLPQGLQDLLLSDNAISGPPLEKWVLPASLQTLFLDSNPIGGTISTAWALPTSLQTLELSSCGLTSSIPGTWALPPNLQLLAMANNLISGSLAEGWALPTSLQSLLLHNNSLSSSISPGWQLPASLQHLSLSNNQLTHLPSDWALPGSLAHVEFGANKIQGQIPRWVLQANLSQVGLSNNALTGSLPSEAPPPTLAYLDVCNNSLAGPLPAWSNRSSTSVFIEPGNPDLCGAVPLSPQYLVQTEIARPVPSAPVVSLPACAGASLPSGAAGPSPGVIAGAVVGAVGGLVAAALVVCWCWRRRRHRMATGEEGTLDKAGSELHGKDGNSSEPPLQPGLSNGADGSQDLMASDPLLASLVFKLNTSRDAVAAAAAGPSPDGGTAHGSPSPSSSRGKATCVNMELVKLWLLDFRELQLRKEIGEGSFGKVYLGKWRETQVAVKLLLDPGSGGPVGNIDVAVDRMLSEDNLLLAKLAQEASMMASLRHPNILSLLGTCLSPPCLVSEFCPRGSVYDILQAARASPALAKTLNWERRLRMAMGVARGMLYLHSRKPAIIHRDLKTPNLLVDQNWVVKVADFNLSKLMEETCSVASSTAVTNPRWLAPEVLSGQSHTVASDVFSFAVVLWEMLTWRLPWADVSSPWQVVGIVMSGGRLEVPPPAELPGDGGRFEGLGAYLDLMERSWAHEPQDRPAFGNIIVALRKLLALATKSSSFNEEDAAPSTRQGSAAPSSSASSNDLPGHAESLCLTAGPVAATFGPTGPFAGSGMSYSHTILAAESQGTLGGSASEPALTPDMSRELPRALSKHWIRLSPATPGAAAPGSTDANETA